MKIPDVKEFRMFAPFKKPPRAATPQLLWMSLGSLAPPLAACALFFTATVPGDGDRIIDGKMEVSWDFMRFNDD